MKAEDVVVHSSFRARSGCLNKAVMWWGWVVGRVSLDIVGGWSCWSLICWLVGLRW
jgi:hypothetical protein